MPSEEIKFRILYTMYCQHFKSGGLANATDRGIAIEAGLEDVDPNELRSEIDSLTKNGFLKIGGRGESGYQLFIGIETSGIEIVQNIADKSMESIPSEIKDEQFQAKLEDIFSEKDTTEKTKRFFDLALQHKMIAKHVFDVVEQQLFDS